VTWVSTASSAFAGEETAFSIISALRRVMETSMHPTPMQPLEIPLRREIKKQGLKVNFSGVDIDCPPPPKKSLVATRAHDSTRATNLDMPEPSGQDL
jgi:hypothetical protein